jgi:hypothetical protein
VIVSQRKDLLVRLGDDLGTCRRRHRETDDERATD